jgi:plasmid stability protein
MANLTIAIDDELLLRARVRALEQHTSVNSLVRDYLEAYADAGAKWRQAADSILQLAARTHAGRGNRRWTRDELHER